MDVKTAKPSELRSRRWGADDLPALGARLEDTRGAIALVEGTAREEKRALRASEQRDVDRLREEVAAVEDAIGVAQAMLDARRVVSPTTTDAPPMPVAESYGSSFPATNRGSVPLKREERVSDWTRNAGIIRPETEGLSFGKYLRGLVTGNWQGADAERRALVEGTLSAGGHLVPTPLSAEIIDRARNQARVFQAGARTIPMTSETLKLAKTVGDPESEWRSENEEIVESTMEFDSVTFRARSLAVLVKASWEVIEDSIGIDDVLLDAFAQELALKLDYTSLYGSGLAPVPRGVKVSGVHIEQLGAVPEDFDFIVDARGRLQAENHDATGVILAPRTQTDLAKLKDKNDQPLNAPEFVREVPRFATNQVPTNLQVTMIDDSPSETFQDCSDAFVADWQQLMIGMRTELQLLQLVEKYADTGQVGFIAHLRADVQVAHPEAFDVTEGIRSA